MNIIFSIFDVQGTRANASTRPLSDPSSFPLPPASVLVLIIIGIALAVQGRALRSDFYMDDSMHILLIEDLRAREVSN